MKKLARLSLAAVVTGVLASGGAWADQVSIYTAKFTCGDGGFSSADPSSAGGVTNAFYRSAINIANPNNRSVTVFKQVVLTEARSITGMFDVVAPQPSAPLAPIDQDLLVSRGAVQWDCDQLGEVLNNHDFSTGGFAAGFLIVTSNAVSTSGNAPVNVVGIHTTIGKNPGDKGTSIDVEEVQGRKINDANNQVAADHHEDGN